MTSSVLQHLETTPKWLALSFASSACFLVAVGVGVLFNQFNSLSITPYTLLLHLLMAISLSAWILSLKIKLSSERRTLLSIGLVVAVGSVWSTLQQWLGYVQVGLTSDITLVAGAMLLDAAGGCVTYVLFRLNVLRK